MFQLVRRDAWTVVLERDTDGWFAVRLVGPGPDAQDSGAIQLTHRLRRVDRQIQEELI
jgi:hypothetical protein